MPSSGMKNYKNVDEYIKHVSPAYFDVVKQMRSLANKLIPDGEEVIRYGMPTIQLKGKNFIHYAAMKGHLGFYPTPSGVANFEKELIKQGLSYSKGCIRFLYTKPLPVALITKIIKYRLREVKNI